jgi:hypothetical protein
MTDYDDRPDDDRYTIDPDAPTSAAQQRQRQQQSLRWLLVATLLGGGVVAIGVYVVQPTTALGVLMGTAIMMFNLWAIALGVGAALEGGTGRLMMPIVTAMMMSIAMVFVTANRWPSSVAGVGVGLCTPAIGGLLMSPLRRWWGGASATGP